MGEEERKVPSTNTVEMYIEAAEGGEYLAQYYLGKMYRDGDRVLQDYEKAAKWFEKASRKGYADAQFSLGVLYGKGLGVPRNYEKMLTWVRKAALQNHKFAVQLIDDLKKNGIAITLTPGERRIEELEALIKKNDSGAARKLSRRYDIPRPNRKKLYTPVLILLGVTVLVVAFAYADHLLQEWKNEQESGKFEL